MSPRHPRSLQGLPGSQSLHVPVGAPWVGAVLSGRQRPGVGDKGGPAGAAPRPAPFPGGERPAPAGPDAGGAGGNPGVQLPPIPYTRPAP